MALICATTTWADWTEVSTAEALRNTISNEAQIRLTANIILADYLKIGENSAQNVTIDMNGYSLKRSGLFKAERNGHIIEVWGAGTLTLFGGTLSGGWANNGGGICNYGTVTLSNATITGCKANDGGAIKNNDDATLNLNGGVNISGNVAAKAGGAIWSAGTLNISGTNNITGNERGGSITNNIYLIYRKVITVTGDLGDSHIGVSVDDHDGVITSGLSVHGDASDFTNDMAYATDLSTEGGEIKLTEKNVLR